MNSSDKLGKLPPQNLEAERSVLGAMLLEKGTIPKVLQKYMGGKDKIS